MISMKKCFQVVHEENIWMYDDIESFDKFFLFNLQKHTMDIISFSDIGNFYITGLQKEMESLFLCA